MVMSARPSSMVAFAGEERLTTRDSSVSSRPSDTMGMLTVPRDLRLDRRRQGHETPRENGHCGPMEHMRLHEGRLPVTPRDHKAEDESGEASEALGGVSGHVVVHDGHDSWASWKGRSDREKRPEDWHSGIRDASLAAGRRQRVGRLIS